jgi:hypothetical protein
VESAVPMKFDFLDADFAGLFLLKLMKGKK